MILALCVNAKSLSASIGSKRGLLVHGLAPLVHYLVASVPAQTVDALDGAGFGDLVHEAFEHAERRTKLVRKFADVLESDSEWALVCAALLTLKAGGDAPGPGNGSGSSTTATWSSDEPAAPFWRLP